MHYILKSEKSEIFLIPDQKTCEIIVIYSIVSKLSKCVVSFQMTQNDTCVIQMTQMTQHKTTQNFFFTYLINFRKYHCYWRFLSKICQKNWNFFFWNFFWNFCYNIFENLYSKKIFFVSFCVVSFCVIQMTRVLCHLNDTNDTTLDSLVSSHS